jgi:predicted phosphodiesterase
MAKYTANQLTEESVEYINRVMNRNGIEVFTIGGFKALAVHGSLTDNYWKAIMPDDLRGNYSGYDFVFSGHSHYSHCFTKFYDCDNAEMRNKKAVIFINPGSVGQPRNHNPLAHYALLDADTLNVQMRTLSYDIDATMALYDGSVDEFYRTRLKTGV